MVNKAYWKKYYKDHPHDPPSAFALWAGTRLDGHHVVDFGCGNGRDTLFFDSFIPATGIDSLAPEGINYERVAAGDYMAVIASQPTWITYARWFLHAVEEEIEDQLLEWTQGQLLVEARVEGDELDDTHWRRPINTTKFLEKLLRLNYEISYFEVSRTFSPPGLPLLFRVDAKRKGVSSSS